MNMTHVWFLASQIFQGKEIGSGYMEAMQISPECLPAARLEASKAEGTYANFHVINRQSYLLRELTACIERDLIEQRQITRGEIVGVAK